MVGQVLDITFKTKKEYPELTGYLKEVLENLPEKWIPAHPSDILDSEFSPEENNLKVKVNSKIRVGLSAMFGITDLNYVDGDMLLWCHRHDFCRQGYAVMAPWT